MNSSIKQEWFTAFELEGMEIYRIKRRTSQDEQPKKTGKRDKYKERKGSHTNTTTRHCHRQYKRH